MLNLSVEEIDDRIDRYEKDQVILGYQAVVDPEKIDADAVTAFIEVSITPERGGGCARILTSDHVRFSIGAFWSRP